MTTGRKPTPSNLKLFRGTDRKDREKKEPKPQLEIPNVPPHLSDEAKVEWGRVSQDLYTLGLLSKIDRAALAAYCEAWSDWKMATEKVAVQGMVIKTGEKVVERLDERGEIIVERTGGNFIENPYYSIKKRAAELMHKFLTEFGMTPSSRTRIDVGKAGGIPGAKTPAAPAGRWGTWGS